VAQPPPPPGGTPTERMLTATKILCCPGTPIPMAG